MGKNQTIRNNANLFAEMLTAKGIDNSRHDNSKYSEYCNVVYVGKHKIMCWNHSNDITLCYDKYIASLVDSTTASQCAEYDSNGKQFICHSTDASQTHSDTLATAVATIEYIIDADAEKARAKKEAEQQKQTTAEAEQQTAEQQTAEAEQTTAKQKAKQKARAKQKAKKEAEQKATA